MILKSNDLVFAAGLELSASLSSLIKTCRTRQIPLAFVGVRA
jgi:hypothetical protein